MDFPYRIPGTSEPEITIRRSAFGNVSVMVAGQKLKRRGPGLRYDVPLADGATTELIVSGQWRGLKALANGVETPLEPPVSPIFVLLIFVPLLLVVIGGLIGGVVGVLTSAANMVISRRRLAGPIKLAAMIGVVVIGVVGYFGIALMIAPIPRLATGDCLNGVTSGAELDARALRAVSCAGAHDNEVVGTIMHPGTGAFPGEQAIFDAAEPSCRDEFEEYVGISFDESVLEMVVVTPSDFTWLRGDRTVVCVVGTVDGSKLTGSVRGSGR